MIRSKPRPCYINALPPELLMEILAYLPSIYNAYTRVHIDPLLLPDLPGHRDDPIDGDESDVDSKERLYRVTNHENYGNCLAELYFPHGCLRFCSERRWNFLSVLCVCKRWQAAVRTCPGFWNTIDDIVRQSLQLSGSLPLTSIVVHSPAGRPPFLYH